MPNWQQTLLLFHKAWRESRAMFAACCFITFVNTWLAFDRTYEAILAKRITNPPVPFEVFDGTYRVWGILFAVLGAGCLGWETRQGGSAFSLSLPIRPVYLNLIRGAMGALQVIIVSSLPSYVAGWLHHAVRPQMEVPILPAFTMAGIALGFASFGIAYLAGSLVPNFYLAIGAGWLAGVVLSVILSLFRFTDSLASMAVLRAAGSLPPKPIAWCPVCAYWSVGILLVLAGAFLAESRSRRPV